MKNKTALIVITALIIIVAGALAWQNLSSDSIEPGSDEWETAWFDNNPAKQERRAACSEVGGTYDECGSACENGQACITLCVERCYFE